MRKTVGIIGNELIHDGNPSQRLAASYIRVVADMVGATPLMIPGLPETQDIGHLVGVFDGIVLTGGRANVHPEEWGATPSPAHEPYDRGRDRVALPLVRACVEAGLPLLGICRGMQEMNVAFGGTLHPEIRDLPGRMNHRMPRGDDVTREEVFRPRHCVHLVPGGTFARLYGSEEIFVNSLHGQGICEPAGRVVIEGRSDDTTPEAITIADAPGFSLGVQWHAEYDPRGQAVNAVIWDAFRKAVEGRDWLPGPN